MSTPPIILSNEEYANCCEISFENYESLAKKNQLVQVSCTFDHKFKKCDIEDWIRGDSKPVCPVCGDNIKHYFTAVVIAEISMEHFNRNAQANPPPPPLQNHVEPIKSHPAQGKVIVRIPANGENEVKEIEDDKKQEKLIPQETIKILTTENEYLIGKKAIKIALMFLDNKIPIYSVNLNNPYFEEYVKIVGLNQDRIFNVISVNDNSEIYHSQGLPIPQYQYLIDVKGLMDDCILLLDHSMQMIDIMVTIRAKKWAHIILINEAKMVDDVCGWLKTHEEDPINPRSYQIIYKKSTKLHKIVEGIKEVQLVVLGRDYQGISFLDHEDYSHITLDDRQEKGQKEYDKEIIALLKNERSKRRDISYARVRNGFEGGINPVPFLTKYSEIIGPEIIQRSMQFIDRNNLIYEIGSGNGATSLFFEQHGYKMVCVDPNPESWGEKKVIKHPDYSTIEDIPLIESNASLLLVAPNPSLEYDYQAIHFHDWKQIIMLCETNDTGISEEANEWLFSVKRGNEQYSVVYNHITKLNDNGLPCRYELLVLEKNYQEIPIQEIITLPKVHGLNIFQHISYLKTLIKIQFRKS